MEVKSTRGYDLSPWDHGALRNMEGLELDYMRAERPNWGLSSYKYTISSSGSMCSPYKR